MAGHEDPIAAQAAAYFARRRSTSWSDADEAALQAWLHAEPAHGAAWLEYERLWGLLDAVKTDSRVQTMRVGALSRQHRWRTPRGIPLAALGMAAAVLAGFALWVGLAHFRTGTVAGRVFATGVGQRSEIVLADGSEVTLDTATTLRVEYSPRMRLIILERGQAYFEVAKNHAWPFVVAADGRGVLATGTQFNVWKRPGGLQVVLVEGRVQVSRESAPGVADSTAPDYLTPGTMLTAAGAGPARIESVNSADATSWRTGRLVFDGERLGDAVAQMNRYWGRHLVLTDTALADRKITAVFSTSTSAASIAGTLQTYGLARVVSQSPTAIYLAPP